MRNYQLPSRVNSDASLNEGNDTSYDEIYVQSWKAALTECEKTLEQHDHKRALLVRSVNDFRKELDNLISEYPNPASRWAISLIHPTLDHYEAFAQNFVKMMSQAVDVAMLWGLLFLVFKLALGEAEAENHHLRSITKWLEKIGHKLRASNEGLKDIKNFSKVKFDATEVNRELVVLWLNIIMAFRNQGQDHNGWLSLDENAWSALTAHYNATYQTIDEAVKRIERVAEMTIKHAQLMLERARFQQLLSLPSSGQPVSLPCNTLPVAQNFKFFGREEELKVINDYLRPTDVQHRMTSLPIYGLGGIGKTQIALTYAYQQLEHLDAVLWIPVADSVSIQQGFSRVATHGLKLQDAQPGAHQENMLLVLDWLQRTPAKWLLIFDNVDKHDVLDDCWPAAGHGAVLVTTRDALVATLPIDRGHEIGEFETTAGADFLLHLASGRRKADDESVAAREVAIELGGLPLALNQMAALINARKLSINDFKALYAKHARRLHTERKAGWRYLGYNHALDTVWDLSFSALEDDARIVLGVLSFVAPDAIPEDIFRLSQSTRLPQVLSFCEDELRFGDALEQLTHHALVRRNIDNSSYRVHRLVQSEYVVRMTNAQEKFEATVSLLLDKFPSQRGNTYDDDEWLSYERYIPQVLALMRKYNDAQKVSNPLKPTMDFVLLLVNAANAVHDNDTANIVESLLTTADAAYWVCPEGKRDRLLWAFLQSLKCMHHLSTSDFVKAEEEMRDGLNIRLELLTPDDLLLALAYSWLSMAIASQGRYQEGLDLLYKAGSILEGPAGDAPTRKMVWGFNISRNLYCMGQYTEAERLLTLAVADAESRQSWYNQVYAHVTMASLRIRMNQIDVARTHVEMAKSKLETSGTLARFSWVGAHCAYRTACVAMLQGNTEEAIEQTDIAVVIGKLTHVPPSILARYTHLYANALERDPSRQKEASIQRLEARRLRTKVPGGGGDLDDESDEAFEMLVKMDQR